MPFGVITARRGWLEARDVLNALPLAEFAEAISKQSLFTNHENRFLG